MLQFERRRRRVMKRNQLGSPAILSCPTAPSYRALKVAEHTGRLSVASGRVHWVEAVVGILMGRA